MGKKAIVTRTGRVSSPPRTGDSRPSPGTCLDGLVDGDLARRCASGDQSAWNSLVMRYRRLVYSIPCRAGLKAEDADDVFQMTFARLVPHVGALRDPSRVGAWLLTTARRLTRETIDRRRTIRNDEALLVRISGAESSPLEEMERRETRERLRRALEALDERSRRLLDLLFRGGERVSYQAIAQKLDIPVGSIGPTRARCLKRLLAEYERPSIHETCIFGAP